MSKKLDLRVRRKRARAASEHQARVRIEALADVRALILSAITPLNDDGRDPVTRAQTQARRGVLPVPGLQWSPEELQEIADDRAAGLATTRALLEAWDLRTVQDLLEQVVIVGAEYVLQPSGGVELQPRLSRGPASAMAALALAQARHLLGQIFGAQDPFSRRVKRCGNPSCKKWFFDAERGTRKWCCVPCGNAHRQLMLSKDYHKRLRADDYARRRAPCSRLGCDG